MTDIHIRRYVPEHLVPGIRSFVLDYLDLICGGMDVSVEHAVLLRNLLFLLGELHLDELNVVFHHLGRFLIELDSFV